MSGGERGRGLLRQGPAFFAMRDDLYLSVPFLPTPMKMSCQECGMLGRWNAKGAGPPWDVADNRVMKFIADVDEKNSIIRPYATLPVPVTG